MKEEISKIRVLLDVYYQPLFTYLIFPTTLFVCWIKQTNGLEDYLDISFYDESIYLLRGVTSEYHNNSENGPLYMVWYKLLSFIEHDRLLLYFLNWKLVAFLPAITFYFLLITQRCNHFIAFMLASAFLWSDANFLQWPRISNYCVAVINLGLIIASLQKSTWQKIFCCAITAIAASYVRPEFFLAFWLFIVILAYYSIYYRQQWNPKKTIAILSLIFVLELLKYSYEWPVYDKKDGIERSFIAFAQYHAVINFPKLGISDNPWLQWEPLFRQNFGDAHSLKQAFLNNPKIFTEQLLTNLINFGNKFYLFFPACIYQKILPVNIVLGNFIVYFLGLYSLIFWWRRKDRKIIFAYIRANLIDILIAFVFIIPAIIGCILFYPRDHYMYLIVVPLVIIFINIIPEILPAATRNNSILFASCLCITLYCLGPNINSYYMNGKPPTPFNTIVKTIREQNIKSDHKINILEEEGGFYIFLGDHYQGYGAGAKNSGFNDFMKSFDFNIIWMTPGIWLNPNFSNDPEFQHFINNYEKINYKKVTIKDCSCYLLIKKSS